MRTDDLSERNQKRTLQDIILILVIAIPVYVLASIFDFFEMLVTWSQEHEEWITVLTILTFASAIFSVRRWRELKEEISQRKQAEDASKFLREFQNLIMTISTSFINLGPDQIDHGIRHALERIGKFALVDRSYVFLFSENGSRMDNTHEWCAPGIESQIERLKAIRVDEALPWFSEIIKRHEVFYAPRIADLPPEASAEKERFQLQGIQSLVIVPMVYGANLIGFLGFDSVHAEKTWDEDIVALLNIAGEIFTYALERKRTEEELRRSQDSAQRLARENAIVAEISRIFSSTLNIEEVYERFAEEVRKLIPFDRIVIDLNQPEKNTFTIAYVAGAEILGRGAGDIFSLGGSDNEYLISSKSSLLIQSEEESELAHCYPILLPTFRAGFRSMMSIPLISKSQVIGGLHFRLFKRHAYTDFDLKLAERVGTHIAGAIANAQLFTEHKQTEAALSVERQRFQTLSEDAPFGMVLIDPQDHFIYANLKFKELFGYDLREIPNGRIWFKKAFPAPGYRHQVVAAWIQDLESFNRGERKSRIFSVTCKDGSEKIISFISVQLATGEHLLTCEDITQHKRAEEALKESEARYRSLFDGVPVGLYRTTQDGRILDANLTLIQMLGYPDSESFMKVKAEALYLKPENRIQWQDLLEREGILQHFEEQLRRRDGTLIWVEENARAYRGSDNQVLYYEGSLEDVTEKKEATAEKLTLQEQLRQSQKMEAIGRLAGGIAHDFNNLLTVISGYSQLSVSTLREGNPLRENIIEIQRAAERAAALTRQLLAFSRRQILDMRLIDLNAVVQDLDKMLRRVIGEDIELVTSLVKGLWKIKSDPSQIEQVILNLAVNARDAMPRGGKLTIETSNIELNQEYARSHIGVKPGSYVQLLIKDTGVGMPPEVMERAFEPFFTTKEKGKGTGLGLSTVYGIVKQSGGNIWLQSELGRGTTFEVYLPKTDEIEESFKPISDSPSRLRGSETILLVEDEEAVRILALKTLQNYGYHILEAANGKEAIRVAQEYEKGRIHLLLTDVVMPGMSGREVSERLSPVCPRIKTLYISGYTDSAIVHHGILEPGTALLLKPFKPDALAHKVREILDGPSMRP
jgi:two-component system cell cycle sensor histidine kinase/response regulator CckA